MLIVDPSVTIRKTQKRIETLRKLFMREGNKNTPSDFKHAQILPNGFILTSFDNLPEPHIVHLTRQRNSLKITNLSYNT